MEKKKIIAVVGPTASGKTGLAIDLAKKYDGEIISADSMQIYSELSIGTAKPSMDERQGIPHHMMGFLSILQNYSVADYVSDAKKVIEDVIGRGKMPILCGGTGLYVDSLLSNTEFAEIQSDSAIRKRLEQLAEEEGKEKFFERLQAVDPQLSEKLHYNNLGRVIRALEVYELTGKTMTELQELSHQTPSPYDVCYIGTNYSDREKLYERIEHRNNLMLKEGVLEEAKFLFEHGENCTAAQAIGYKEFYPYLKGEITLDEAMDVLKKETRHYAKRQLTWFRRNNKISWLCWDEFNDREALLAKAYDIINTWREHEK